MDNLIDAPILLDSPKRDIFRVLDFAEEVGRGSFGVVRKCRDKWTGRQLACKVLEKSQLKCRAQAVRREVDVLTKLAGHPNIVALAGAYEDANCVYLVMEHCRGGDLCDEINARQAFPEAEAADIFRQLMSAVAFCHANGVLHRDLKPENVFLIPAAAVAAARPGVAARPAAFNVKLGDFGQAVYLLPGERTEGACGSLFYLAPEQVRGNKYDFAADVWSCGIILCDLLLGKLPFPPCSRDALKQAIAEGRVDFDAPAWRHVSPPARALARSMLAPNCWQRPSAQDILADPWLQAHCSAGRATRGPSPSPLAPLSPNRSPPLRAALLPFRQLGVCDIESRVQREHDNYVAKNFASVLKAPRTAGAAAAATAAAGGEALAGTAGGPHDRAAAGLHFLSGQATVRGCSGDDGVCERKQGSHDSSSVGGTSSSGGAAAQSGARAEAAATAGGGEGGGLCGSSRGAGSGSSLVWSTLLAAAPPLPPAGQPSLAAGEPFGAAQPQGDSAGGGGSRAEEDDVDAGWGGEVGEDCSSEGEFCDFAEGEEDQERKFGRWRGAGSLLFDAWGHSGSCIAV